MSNYNKYMGNWLVNNYKKIFISLFTLYGSAELSRFIIYYDIANWSENLPAMWEFVLELCLLWITWGIAQVLVWKYTSK